MKLKDFELLLKNAKEDENGNLFIYEEDYAKLMPQDFTFKIDEESLKRKHYFGFLYTVCDDLIEEYCSKHDEDYELYDRHFTGSDDTLEVQIIRN